MTIRSDATRLRIVTKDKRRQRAVVARQGQVLLDTDFDQQSRLEHHRIETETLDSLGSPGRLVVPAGNSGFQITPDGAQAANFNIGAGRGYLQNSSMPPAGWLLENPEVCKLTTQPHPRTGDPVNLPSVIALKALIRHIDPVEEPVLADVALGDAQASGRSLVDWQVFPLPATAPISCFNVLTKPEWAALIAPSTGTLAVVAQAAAPSNDPCSLTPGGGYTRLENLLYRVEVHGGTPKGGNSPTIDGPRFGLAGLKVKFSRRNASVMVRITNISGTDFTVAPPALDARNWFAPGNFAEIVSIHDDVDPRAALANERLFRVANATDDHVILEAQPAQVTATGAAADGTWFLRLWDAFPSAVGGVASAVVQGGSQTSNDIDLGDGLKIRLGGGANAAFRRGDHWTCAARADGSIDWPIVGGVPELQTPHGPETRYAPLAIATGAAASPFEDCRIPFATLTDRALLYRGGDGQAVFAPGTSGMVALPGKLRVAVMRGETPVLGAFVRWTLVPGAPACQINGVACNAGSSIDVQTDANGLVEVTWSIDAAQKLVTHQVQAQILATPTTLSQPPLVFSATFETAEHTSYLPGKCSHLVNITNVQDALDTLCLKIPDKFETLTLTSILLINTKQTTIDLVKDAFIQNALEVQHDAFNAGIAFAFNNGPLGIDIANFPYDPLAEIELDLPYPTTDPDKTYWAQIAGVTVGGKRTTISGPFGFQRVRLDGGVQVVAKGDKFLKNGGLLWTPSVLAARFLDTAPHHAWGQNVSPNFSTSLPGTGWTNEPRFPRVMCRIRLRSTHIWVDDKKSGDRIYLNAEHMGTKEKLTLRELQLKERDPQRAADLDMYIYLAVPPG